MPLNTNGLNASAAGLADVVTHISLHTADPGATGTSEVTGGSPAYARQPVTWAAPAGGIIGISNDPEYDIPAGTTISYYGLWSAASGGTFYGGHELSDAEAYAAQGVFILTSDQVTYTPAP